MVRSDPECIFCRIVRREIPGDIVFETDTVVAFRDIQPAAPTHILIVPREHVASIAALADSDATLVSALVMAARTIAEQQGLVERGYRVVSNIGDWGGQTVDHLHLHVLGGRQLGALG